VKSRQESLPQNRCSPPLFGGFKNGRQFHASRLSRLPRPDGRDRLTLNGFTQEPKGFGSSSRVVGRQDWTPLISQSFLLS
jgi:hypothetical protein